MPKLLREANKARLIFSPDEQEIMNKTLAWVTAKNQGGRIAGVDRKNLTFDFNASPHVYEALEQRISQLQNPIKLPVKTGNPLAHLKPLNSSVAYHMRKDIAMADEASQFIGKSSAPANTPSSTRNYEQAWGELANTGIYTPQDIIMISGSGPWRGVTNRMIDNTFQEHYIPLLDKAKDARSGFVVGDAAGIDSLTRKYLSGLAKADMKGYSRFTF